MPDASPFHVADDASVRPGAWSIATPSGDAPLPEWLRSWDLGERLQLSRRMLLDVDALLASSGLEPSTRVAITVVVATPSFSMVAARQSASLEGEAVDVTLLPEISGHLAAGTAALRTTVTLDETLADPGPRVASRRGSVLWRDERKVRLHGDGSQFPVMVVDFVAAGLEAGAPWMVDLDDDLHRPVMGSIALLVNERFSAVVDAMTDKVGPEQSAVVRSVVFADVGRTMLERALTTDDILGEWPQESLGAVLRDLLAGLPAAPDELRRERDLDPARWAARCHATFRLMGEPR